ncbi:MAG: chloride channel protein [Proteobacteria bacterium]|nr:chloride channel protein [Pseudomonadota bacterium]
MQQGARLHSIFRRLKSLSYALRANVRGSELGVVLLSAAVGVASGLVVSEMHALTSWMHDVMFGVKISTRITNPWGREVASWVFIPMVGGLLVGISAWLAAKVRKKTVVDPIEANALHGGVMSLRDSLILTGQTILSNGFGASVGLEAGYTQIGGALGSKLGGWFRLRREDLRVLVAAAAAAGIAAAFGAPLTGAFYGFEIILGAYSIAAAAPVLVAAVAGNLTAKALGSVVVPIDLPATAPTLTSDYLVFIAMGFVCGLIGIAIMRASSLVEEGFRLARVPVIIRPAIGGLMVGALALVSPQVLWEGHVAMHTDVLKSLSLVVLLGLFMLKATASVVSIGSGFRGGLFFASLFLGVLLGKMLTLVGGMISIHLVADPVTAAVVGMSGLAVAVIGGPLTMTFLALESTGDFVITGIVLATAIFASMTVRELFGYSFSTWRLHLRGETIRSAHDVGWIRSLTVGKLMQTNVVTVRDRMNLAEFRRLYPMGSVSWVAAVDDADHYVGIVFSADVYAPGREGVEGNIHGLLKHHDSMLTPAMNVKQALAAFDAMETDALVVVDDRENRKVLGLLTEGFALKRYAAELDRARRALAGEK